MVMRVSNLSGMHVILRCSVVNTQCFVPCQTNQGIINTLFPGRQTQQEDVDYMQA